MTAAEGNNSTSLMQFHLYQDGIEVAEPAIYARDLKAYAADSRRALADRILRKRTKVRTSIKTHWNNIMGRSTLSNSSVSLLLAALLASHCIYA
jgi:hypothetical protein